MGKVIRQATDEELEEIVASPHGHGDVLKSVATELLFLRERYRKLLKGSVEDREWIDTFRVALAGEYQVAAVVAKMSLSMESIDAAVRKARTAAEQLANEMHGERKR